MMFGGKSIVGLLLSLNCGALPRSATYFKGRLASFEVVGTLARLVTNEKTPRNLALGSSSSGPVCLICDENAISLK